MEKLTLRQMLEFGQNAWADTSKLLASARWCQAELPKRLARRLLDLQLLPHLVVANPHIGRVYSSYYHAFNTLRAAPPVTTARRTTPSRRCSGGWSTSTVRRAQRGPRETARAEEPTPEGPEVANDVVVFYCLFIFPLVQRRYWMRWPVGCARCGASRWWGRRCGWTPS